ncbi:bacterioferritin-associated ferredoxin [Vibrio sp. SM6]|uniref:Bacterioferritin-associated ferredoxin n=1 Tax=Vibrio agarilyticus TaxID=2726741 RepID=A0A7X8TQM6_9VIBR|nr:bacterioferritin-associated ferredoxin [Vibrio agarilyticus]NLS12463.1 bacterioferritin-associated ferredoxin [Vibrio agarilyticus]
MYVCLCHGVSDKKIRRLVSEEGVTDLKGIKRCTRLGSQCGKCLRQARQIIDETLINQYRRAS